MVEEDGDAVGVLAFEGEAVLVEPFGAEVIGAVDDVELFSDRYQPGLAQPLPRAFRRQLRALDSEKFTRIVAAVCAV